MFIIVPFVTYVMVTITKRITIIIQISSIHRETEIDRQADRQTDRRTDTCTEKQTEVGR